MSNFQPDRWWVVNWFSMWTRSILALYLLAICGASQPNTVAGGKRLALVIGNEKYTMLPQLPEAKLDADLISQALRNAGFEIHPVPDFELKKFIELGEPEFAKLLGPADICVIYFAGYAIQGDDDNYLLPVEFDPGSSNELKDRAYHFQRLLQNLNAGLKMIVLETPPPISVSVQGSPGGAGLMDPQIGDTTGTLFLSAAFPNQWIPVSQAGQPGLLTQALAKRIDNPCLSLIQVFDNAAQDVQMATGGLQTPFLRSSVGQQQRFFFHEPKPEVCQPPQPAPSVVPAGPRTNIPTANRTDHEEYLLIPAGKFLMGCVPADTRCHPEEKPQHQVTISSGFWIGRNEVQRVSFQLYVSRQDKKKVRMPPAGLWPNSKEDNQPIVNVRWEEAEAYCSWAGGRLPTEAEWEYAARGGVANEVYPGNDENSRDKANFDGRKGNDIYDFAAPVRKFDPNQYGLFDMSGNVWEWTGDFFSPSYFTKDPATDPTGPPSGKEHVIRGGSFDSDPKEHLRLSFRKGFGNTAPSVGFRCVIEAGSAAGKLLSGQAPQ